MSAAEDYDGTELPVTVIRKEVEHRFGLPFRNLGAVKKPIEQLGRRLGRLRPQHEYSGRKFLVMIQMSVLQRCQMNQAFVIPSVPFVIPSEVEEPLHIRLQRHKSLRSRLKMMMVRSGCTAFRAIVEEGEVLIFPCQVKHVNIPFPDGLVSMPVRRNHKMVRENRIWIDKDMVFLSLTALELHHDLLRRPVLAAKEAPSLGYIGLVQLRC